MKKFKAVLNEIFIDGLSGMALGLFSTLIIGTIIAQIGTLIGGAAGSYIIAVSNVAKTLTGVGIGVGVACKFKEGPLVTVSAAVAGMIGAFPSLAALESYALGKPGEPLGAFIAALVAIKVGHLVAGKTKVDILVTPFVSIASGAVAGIVAGPPISAFMVWLGQIVNFNVEQHPIIGGIIVSVLMGMILTLPISSAAIVFTTRSPISLVHWKSKKRMRSSGSVRTASSRPPVKCLRSSMQKEIGRAHV